MSEYQGHSHITRDYCKQCEKLAHQYVLSVAGLSVLGLSCLVMGWFFVDALIAL